MKRLAIATFLLSLACGEVRSAGDLGEPIYTVRGDLEGTAINPEAGEHRAIFGWVRLAGAEITRCIEENPGADALSCLNHPISLETSVADVPVRPVFPASFELPIHELPPESASLTHEDATLAFGAVAIYRDQNRNGELDSVGPRDEASIDTVVASSLRAGEPSTFLMLREGGVHPLWPIIQELYDCPDLPSGLSVLRLGPVGVCSPAEGGRFMVTPASDSLARLIACHASLGALSVEVQKPVSEPPPNAVVSCLDDGTRLWFWMDEGHYCDAVSSVFYDLTGPGWNFTNSPPEWWSKYCPN
jgi:hypothetical protein